MKIGPLEIHPQRIAIFFGIAILLFLIMDFNTRLEGLSRLQNQLSTVQMQGTNVIITQYALQTGVAYATSDAAVQEYARSQARMVQPGETIGLDGTRPFRVKIGNAAVTQIVFRGQPVELAAYTRDNVAKLELK